MNDKLISRYESIKTEMSVDSEGRVTFTISGTARLIGIDKSSLSKNFSVDRKGQKLSRMLIDKGFNPLTFGEEGIPDLAVALIVKYYAYETQHPRQEAKLTDLAMAGIGIRQWGRDLLGWKSNDESTLAVIRNEIREMREEQKLYLPAVQKLASISTALEKLPELEPLLKELSKALEEPQSEKFTLKAWVESLDMPFLDKSKITGGVRKTIGRLVSSWIKLQNIQLDKEYGQTGSVLYPSCFDPLLRLAVRYYVLNNGRV